MPLVQAQARFFVQRLTSLAQIGYEEAFISLTSVVLQQFLDRLKDRSFDFGDNPAAGLNRILYGFCEMASRARGHLVRKLRPPPHHWYEPGALATAVHDPVARSALSQELDEIEQHIRDHFDPDDLRLFQLVRLGNSTAAAAEELKLSRNTASKRFSRLCERLREHYSDKTPE